MKYRFATKTRLEIQVWREKQSLHFCQEAIISKAALWVLDKRVTAAARCMVRLYFCAYHFGQKRKMFTFSQAHAHALTNATRRHEYFQGLSRLLPVPGVLVSFLELHFLGKMALLALGGRPEPLKKPSHSSKTKLKK